MLFCCKQLFFCDLRCFSQSWFVAIYCVEKILAKNSDRGEKMTNIRYAEDWVRSCPTCCAIEQMVWIQEMLRQPRPYCFLSNQDWTFTQYTLSRFSKILRWTFFHPCDSRYCYKLLNLQVRVLYWIFSRLQTICAGTYWWLKVVLPAKIALSNFFHHNFCKHLYF